MRRETLSVIREGLGVLKDLVGVGQAVRDFLKKPACAHENLISLHAELPDGAEHVAGTVCQCRPRIQCLLCKEVLEEGAVGSGGGGVSITVPEGG